MVNQLIKQVARLALAGMILSTVGLTAQAQDTGTSQETSNAAVTVTFANPASFAETKQFRNEDHYNNVDYEGPLKAYLIKRASRMLPAGDRLKVTITDIKLAGAYEPWRGPQARYIRYMKDVYPPRIDLDFTLTAANGDVLKQGSRKLRNIGYLQSSLTVPGDNDPLRYDKALLGSWLRKGPQGL